MRYKFIELINYAGIYNGMGINQIRIDFTRCKTNKILIKGNNGSGKSTLINSISPLADSNDKFIPNEEARKIVCIMDNGIEYIIKYIHPVTKSGRGAAKGYIAKLINGEFVELNPSGSITSCNDLIMEEFCIDSNYLSLSQLSSENRGLVELRPSDRKKMYGKILDSLDTYNNMYKTFSKRASGYKTIINSLVSKIDTIGNPATILMKQESINSNLKSLEEERDITIEAIATVKLRISDYVNSLKENNYSSMVKELKEVTDLKNSSKKYIDKYLDKYSIPSIDEVSEFRDYLENEIDNLETEISILKARVPDLLRDRELEYKELVYKQDKLKSLESESNYNDLLKLRKKAQDTVDQYRAIFNSLKNINTITKEEIDTAIESLKRLKEYVNTSLSDFTIDEISNAYYNRSSIEYKVSKLDSMRTKLIVLKDRKSDLEKEYIVYESKRQIAEELLKRPSECEIDSCLFIKYAIEADKKYPKSGYDKLSKDISSITKEIDDLEKEIEDTIKLDGVISRLNLIEKELDTNVRFIYKLPVSRDFRENFIPNRIINMGGFKDIDELYKYSEYSEFLELYKCSLNNLNVYEAEYEVYKEKNNIIESILCDIKSLQDKTDNLANKIEDINNSITDKEKELLDIVNTKQKIDLLYTKVKDEYLQYVEKENALTNDIKSLDEHANELKKAQDSLAQLNSNMAEVNKDIKMYSEQAEKIKHALILLDDYNNELKDYNEKYSKIEKVKYYSSPSTGIQTVYMQLYMNKILTTANNLLSLLFNGEFTLQPFIINETEFRIPCKGHGLMHDDINSMSTAQKSMISMILSFSLLYQSSTKYNIVKTDEIDGGLDTTNRLYFITLLDNLMNILNCEQSFIISHNNELTNYNCDIILLKYDNYDVVNGNIIWKYE